DIDNSPDYQGNMPRENRTKDHAAPDQQGASPIPASPYGDCGVHAKNKQQEQAEMTKHTPWARNADRHRDDLTCPGKVANVSNCFEIDTDRKNKIQDQYERPQTVDAPRHPGSPGPKIESHEGHERYREHP